MHKRWLLISALVLSGCWGVLAGCSSLTSTSPKGRWVEQEEVQQSIENGAIFPGHTYYYLGSIVAPDSFIAVDNRFQLRSRVWSKVAMSPERLAGWLQWYSQEMYGSCDYRAGRIYAPDGTPVGYWYSQNELNNVYMPQPGVIEVYRPHTVGQMVCGEERDSPFIGAE